MLPLLIGLLIFLGIHLVPTNTALRDSLIARFGAGPYKIAFALLSLIGLVIIVLGYYKLQTHPGKNPILWDPPTFTRHIALLLMLPAMIFLVAAYVPSRIRTALKHPMLVAIKIWALAHLLANGDLASLLLFGSFLAYAVYDRISLKRRPVPVPQPPSSAVNDLAVVGLGTAAYLALLFGGHAWLIGVDPLG